MKSYAPRRPFRASSLPWIWTLCLALALRALVPAGTMLDLESRDGFLPGLVLCPVQMPGLPMGGDPSMDGHHHTDGLPQSHASPLCLLAQHAGGSPLPVAAPVLALVTMAVVVPWFAGAVAPPVQRVRGAPLGSRAPPLSFN
ncbi:MAG: DUF2946 family protein [Castellaniella sp.]|uniref:DUF2946 family protein n=1 Tax=Castellaniella sp. TaxID=1955812 RepID=UPI003C71F900